MKNLMIGHKVIGQDRPVYIIAEAGVNHNGRLDLALGLIEAASKAGADAIKFQTFRAKDLVTRTASLANYQRKNLKSLISQRKMLQKLELKEQYYPAIIKRCRQKKITFLSTPHSGFQSVNFLHKLAVPAFKFSSADLTNLPVLQYAAKFQKPMIISTGMATMKEVQEAVTAIKKAGNNKIIVLHCTTNYPCRLPEVNLKAMQAMKKKLAALIGYSDHTQGSQLAIMAATLGACMLEKHLTLSKTSSGPDHRASADPAEFADMVRLIRNVPLILGTGKKKPFPAEKQIAKVARKSLVSQNYIAAGQIIKKEDLAIKRPGTGLPPSYYFTVIGRKARKNIKADSLIGPNDYE